MGVALAGGKVGPTDAEDTIVANMAVDSTVGSAAANFTLTAGTVRSILGGKVIFLSLTLVSTNAITASSGNITDTTCFTLDAAYRPTEVACSAFGGVATGFAVLNTNGTVSLWTSSDTITAGSSFRLSFTYIIA